MPGASATSPSLVFRPGPPGSRGPRAATIDPPRSLEATDPRWVLAMRTAEVMQGARLGVESRQRLIRLGRAMGLNAFESNLVIAIVQDGARRGAGLADAEPSLACVPMYDHRPVRRAWRIAMWACAALIVEVLCLMALFF